MNEILVLRYAPEVYVDIGGYPGYQVSNKGNVRSLDRVVTRKNGRTLTLKGQIITPQKNHKGYLKVRLRKDKKEKALFVHRLTATAFIANPECKPQVNHLNGIKHDNNVCNLSWCSQQENSIHALTYGLIPVGEKHSNSRLSSKQVMSIKQLLREKENSITDIASKFKVAISTVHDIKSGRQWKHIS